MHANPSPHWVWLYRRAVICQAFPAYKLDELRGRTLIELMQAMRLIDTVRKVNS